MSFKWTEAEARTNNIVDAPQFNEAYNNYKSTLNGNIDRDNIPHDSVGYAKLADAAAHQILGVFGTGFSLTGGTFTITATEFGFPGYEYSQYEGGWVQTRSESVTLKEGMLHIELMGFVAQNIYEIEAGAPVAYYEHVMQLKIVVNGLDVLISPEYTLSIEPVHMVCDVPCGGGAATVEVFWRITPPGASAGYPADRNSFYHGSMTMMLLNRYR